MDGTPDDCDALIDSVERREAQASTCLGGGLMVPHGVVKSHHSLLGVMAVSNEGWAFETPDGDPVRCIVLLATPTDAAAHHLAVLAALARLFLLAPELKERLVQAFSPNEVRDILASDEARELNYAFERVAAKPAAWLKPPPDTVASDPLAVLLTPPLAIEKFPVAWFRTPPPTLESSPDATFSKPPVTEAPENVA